MKLGISSFVATVLKRHGDKIYNIMLVFVRKKTHVRHFEINGENMIL